MMKLKKLLKSLPITVVKGSKDIDITGICSHSGLVVPGNLFVARRGNHDDGTRYIPEAIAAGAVAIATDIYNPSLRDITQIISPDIAQLEGDLAAEFYHYPGQELFLVGITGTNGKTTTAFLVKHILDSIGESCGLIGSIEYIIGPARYAANRTTPDVITSHKILREMVSQGCKCAVMEVSSHALEQERTRHLSFEVAAFTNLTQDHLDYHVTMERYAAAKAKLFDPKYHSPKIAVVNHDDPRQQQMLEKFTGEVISFGLTPEAALSARNIAFDMNKSSFEACFRGESAQFQIPLIGRFNLYNCLTAMGIGLAHGLTLHQLQPILASAPSVSGRLQPVMNSRGLHIYVDYAHTPDSLQQVLRCLNELKRGKIITVFGCGGDRDRSKRPIMGKVVQELSDYAIVTADNPRSEDPEQICNEITKGLNQPLRYEVVLDRKEAIRRSIELASPQDIILIAGKGHETYQIFSHKTIEFDDRQIASELCSL